MNKQWHSCGTGGKLSDIPTFNVNDEKMFTAKRHFDGGADKETGPRNPKVQALLDEIINDTPDDVDVTSQTTHCCSATEFII